MTRRWRAWVLLGAVLSIGTGCAPVQPWQRDVLARPQMQPEPHPLSHAAREHAYQAREGASGGVGVGGGGCGCY